MIQKAQNGQYMTRVGSGPQTYVPQDLLPYLQAWLGEGNTLTADKPRERLSPLAPYLVDESSLFGFLPMETRQLIQTQAKHAASVTAGKLTTIEYDWLENVRRSFCIMVSFSDVPVSDPSILYLYVNMSNLSKPIPYERSHANLEVKINRDLITRSNLEVIIKPSDVQLHRHFLASPGVFLDGSAEFSLDVKSFFLIMKKRFITEGFVDGIESARDYIRSFLDKLMREAARYSKIYVWIYLWASARSMELEVSNIDTENIDNQLVEYEAAVRAELAYLH